MMMKTCHAECSDSAKGSLEVRLAAAGPPGVHCLMDSPRVNMQLEVENLPFPLENHVHRVSIASYWCIKIECPWRWKLLQLHMILSKPSCSSGIFLPHLMTEASAIDRHQSPSLTMIKLDQSQIPGWRLVY